jgi:hypothetical protein
MPEQELLAYTKNTVAMSHKVAVNRGHGVAALTKYCTAIETLDV